jgi:ATP-binding cassette, subfamily B, bacterial
VVREGGIKLLGGKRQRIAIARAFLKNLKFLLLNEATSTIDNITEKSIHESLKT